jgi:regulator of protease activity HflC (stomatin/prohibitin superfamily)
MNPDTVTSLIGNTSLFIIGAMVIIALIIVATGIFTVNQQEAALIERLGKYKHVALAGLNFKIPIIDWIAGKVSLRVQQLDVGVNVKCGVWDMLSGDPSSYLRHPNPILKWHIICH